MRNLTSNMLIVALVIVGLPAMLFITCIAKILGGAIPHSKI